MLTGYLKNKYKEILPVLADKAVEAAESLNADGSYKKEFAVNFILNLLPGGALVKVVMKGVLNKVIAEAVEFAVTRLKQVQNAG